MTAGTDQTFDISFPQDLQYCLRHGAQEIAFAILLQQLDKRHSVIGSSWAFGGPCNPTLAHPPDDHLSLTRAPGSMYSGIPPGARSPPKFHHDRGLTVGHRWRSSGWLSTRRSGVRSTTLVAGVTATVRCSRRSRSAKR